MNDKEYCKDCDRSIYGKYHDCDVNIENDGMYVGADEKCYCKITNGKRAERYPWEERECMLYPYGNPCLGCTDYDIVTKKCRSNGGCGGEQGGRKDQADD